MFKVTEKETVIVGGAGERPPALHWEEKKKERYLGKTLPIEI